MLMFEIGVIPAAGIAYRFKGYYYHSILPKVLYPLAGKPLIEYQLENMRILGIKKVFVVVNKDDVTVEKYLERYDRDYPKLVVIHQVKPNGLGDAILTVSNLINNPFVVILGDDLTISKNIKDAAYYFLESGYEALQLSILDHDKEAISRACGIDSKNNLVTQIVEKPVNHNFLYRGIGIYFLKPSIFYELEATPKFGGELRLTDALTVLCERRKLATYNINGFNFNINTVGDLSLASRHISIVHYNYDRQI